MGQEGRKQSWKVEAEAALRKVKGGWPGPSGWGAGGTGLAARVWKETQVAGSHFVLAAFCQAPGASPGRSQQCRRRWVGIRVLTGSSCVGPRPGVSAGDSLPTEAASQSDGTPEGPQPAWKCIQT